MEENTWDDIISKFEALQLWAIKSRKMRGDWDEKPEETPFFVAHADFLYRNAEGMLDLLPLLQDDPRFQDLTMRIDNFIFEIGLPELPHKMVRIWSEGTDEYTISILDVDEMAPKHLDIIPMHEVAEVLGEYLAYLETLLDE